MEGMNEGTKITMDQSVKDEEEYKPPYNFQLRFIQDWTPRDWWESRVVCKMVLKKWEMQRGYDASEKTGKKSFVSKGFKPQNLLDLVFDVYGTHQIRIEIINAIWHKSPPHYLA